MGIFRAQVNTEAFSGASEDVAVTNFYVDSTPTLDASDLDDWTTAIKTLWDTLKGSNGWRGRATGPHTIKFYAEDTSVPNYPFAERTFSFATSGTDYDLPAEVSVALSYANDTNNSVPRARRRGRFYVSGIAAGSNDDGKLLTQTMTTYSTALKDYVDDVNAITDTTAVVYSRSNTAGYEIERVWVDNEFDTLRSRGGRATERSTNNI